MTNTNARYAGVLLWVLVFPSGLLTFVFGFASQHGFVDEQSFSLGAATATFLGTLWLVLAGLALVLRKPPSSLRVPGYCALGAGIIGLAFMLPESFGNPRASGTVDSARILLPWTLGMLFGGVGHLRLARGKSGAAVFHALVPVGFLGSLSVLAALVYLASTS